MKHIKTLNEGNLKKNAAKSGCGECQASASPPARPPVLSRIRSARSNFCCCTIGIARRDRSLSLSCCFFLF